MSPCSLRKTTLLCVMAITVLAAGCSRGVRNDCNKPQGYEGAADAPPLRIPAGLDAMNTRAALRIPEAAQPEPPARKLSDPCLDEPPRYNPNARLLPVPKGAAAGAAAGKPAGSEAKPSSRRWWWPFGKDDQDGR
ncbi:MAG: hypothetical protein RL026_428 [Pseudomonadota bacterium]|jgi:hypothetical protein